MTYRTIILPPATEIQFPIVTKQQICECLKLILTLFKHEPSPRLFDIFAIAESYKSLLFYIVENDEKNCQYLFKLLIHMLDANVPSNYFELLLNLRDKDERNIALLMAEKQDENINDLYILFLQKFYQRSQNCVSIINAIKALDKHGANYIWYLVKTDKLDCFKKLISLCKILIANGIEKAVIQELFSMQTGKLSITDLLYQSKKSGLLLELISSDFLNASCLNSLAGAKNLLMEHILTIDNRFFKKIMLRDALDATLPLGRFFANYYIYSSIFQTLKKESECLENEDRKRWQQQFFPQASEREVDSYLQFIDPFEEKDFSGYVRFLRRR